MTLCGRRARLPRGPAVLARTTGAPLVPVTLHYSGENMTITFHAPVPHADGDEGLALALESTPDVVLLDLDLPGLHGREVLAALRGDERTGRVPILIVSANTLPRSIDEALAAGAAAYLTKPINTREFLRVLDLHLPTAAPELAASAG